MTEEKSVSVDSKLSHEKAVSVHEEHFNKFAQVFHETEEIVTLKINNGTVFFEEYPLFSLHQTHNPEYNSGSVVRDLLSEVHGRPFTRNEISKKVSFW